MKSLQEAFSRRFYKSSHSSPRLTTLQLWHAKKRNARWGRISQPMQASEANQVLFIKMLIDFVHGFGNCFTFGIIEKI
jgi:hypothetical protein